MKKKEILLFGTVRYGWEHYAKWYKSYRERKAELKEGECRMVVTRAGVWENWGDVAMVYKLITST